MKPLSRKLHKVFSLISGLSLIFNSILPAGVLPLLFAPSAAAATPEATTLNFSPESSNFTLTVNSPTDNNPVDYVLSYFKTNTNTVEGVEGSGVTQLTRDILAGTCSSGTCTAHPFNRVLTKVVIDEGTTKWCEAKQYSYDGSLTTKTESVVSCSDTKAFTTLTDAETSWLQTGNEVTPTPTPTPMQGQILDGVSTESATVSTPTPTPLVAPSTEQHESLTAAIVKNTSLPTLNLDSQNILGSATLTTNKPDYAPTDTVVITGNGFIPKYPYKLFVSSTDPPAVNFETEIETDDTGSFIYSYPLDGNYRPNYQVVVKDGATIVATTTFTDADTGFHVPTASVSNNSVTNPDNAWSSNNSYAVFNSSSDNVSYGSFGLNVTSGSTINGIEVDVEGNRTSGRTLDVSLSWNNGTTFTSVENADFASSTDVTKVLGGSSDTWGRTWSSGDFSNTNFLVKVDATSGGGDLNLDFVQVKVTYTVPTTGTLKIVKNTTNGNGTFNFSVTGPSASTPSIVTSSGTGSSGPTTVNPGSYSVKETIPNGWTLTSASCDDGSSTFSVDTVSAINITAGKNVICTFNDSLNRTDLTVTKTNNISDNALTNQTFNWVLTIFNTGTTAIFGNGNTVLTDQLPSTGATYGSVTSVNGNGTTGNNNCSISSNTLTCTSGNGSNNLTIPNGGTVTVTIPVTPTIAGSLVNPRASNGCKVDPTSTNGVISESDEGNNICSNTVTVTDPLLPDLTATKTNDVNGNATTNQAFNWKIRVQNSGAGSATFSSGSTILTDNLPNSSVTYGAVSVTKSDSSVTGTISCSISSSNLSCTASGGSVVIPVGQYFDVSFPATFTTTGSKANPRSGGVCKVDPTSTNGVISESDETNNTCSNSVTVADVQPVANPPLGQACGLDIALILDNSTSIDSTEMGQMKAAMTAFTNALNGTPTQFSVSHFASTATVDQAFISNVTTVNNKINGIPVGGGYTNWEDGFTKGQSTFDPRSNPNLVIFASDGNPNTVIGGSAGGASESTAVSAAQTVANALKTGGTRILAIGIGTDLNTANMQAISGPNVNTGDVLTSDVITTDFAGLATQLAAFATQTCGGTITVHKVVTGEQSPTLSGWHFTINGHDYVTDAQGYTQAVPVASGTYSVTETTQDGYTLTDKVCTKNSLPTGSPVTNGVGSISVGANDIISCTFTNDKNITTGTLTVNKVLVPSNDPGKFNLQIDGSTAGTGANVGDTGTTGAVTVNSGVRTVGETAGTSTTLGDYTSVISGDCNSQGSVTVNPGDSKVCTITNTRNTGSVKVNKLADTNGNGTFETPDPPDFTWSLDGSGTNAMGVAVSNVTTGTHSVNESSLINYHFVGWYLTADTSKTCSNTTNTTLPASITVSKGETANITICNARDTGTVIVHKNVVNPDGGSVTDTSHNFGVRLDGGNEQTLTDNGTVTYSNIPTGSHTVTESTIPSDYALDGITPDGDGGTAGAQITVVSGQTTDVYVTNKQKKATITVVKDVVKSDGSPVLDNHAFTALLNGDNGKSFSENSSNSYSVNPGGPYTVGEGPDDNYTLDGCNLPTRAPATSFNLSSNQSVTVTCTNKQNPGTISGRKLMADGLTGILGWTINLYSCVTSGTNCSFVKSTTTGAGGTFSFDNLVTGFYQVLEGLNPNYTSVGATSHDVTVIPGSTSTGNDFANFKNISISGIKYNDLNGDSTLDAGEPGLPNWTINLYQYENDLPVFVTSTTTDSSGNFSFTNVGPSPDGIYKLAEVNQAGWQQTEPIDFYHVPVADGQNVEGYRFGNFQNVSVTACKQEDPDGLIGTTDGRTNVSGWGVNLIKDGLNVDAPRTTGDNGCYTWSNLGPGNYTVGEQTRSGWTNLTPTTHDFGTVQSGETYTHTFVNTELGNVTVTKYNDHNANGAKDAGDEVLDAWEIHLSAMSQFTGTQVPGSGQVTFSDLLPGSYTLGERVEEGWLQSNISCGSETGVDNDNSHPVNLAAGQDIPCFIGNYQPSTITIIKDADPNDPQDFSFTGTNGLGSFSLDDDDDSTLSNTKVFNNLLPGTYAIDETPLTGWSQGNISCSGSGALDDLETHLGGTSFSIGNGTDVTCTFHNTKKGSVEVTKYNDRNGNGSQDPGEEDLAGWDITLTGQTNQTTDAQGQAIFSDLLPSTYFLDEVVKPGWEQTNISCTSDQSNQEVMNANDSGNLTTHWSIIPQVYAQVVSRGHQINLSAGRTVSCTIGNQELMPILQISKENFAGGDKHPGDTVLFQITVTNLETAGAALSTIVTDLPAGGFTYVPGSGTISKNGGPATPATFSHDYASPGVWDLGTMAPGDTFILSYNATIAGDKQPGLYKDLAWAQGNGADSSTVIAQAENPGFVNDSFVGTEVNVVEPQQNSAGYNVVNTVEGQVLGASTELPATGANAFWLYIAFGLISGSFSIGALGWYIRRRYE